MQRTLPQAKYSEQTACVILAPQVLSLGLRHARPHLWD